MFTNSVSQNKIGVQHRPYWIVSVAPLIVVVLFIAGVAVTPSVWIFSVLFSVLGLALDIHTRRRTMDSWRPQIVFWPTMLAIMVLSGGLASVIVVPGYLLEMLLNR